jgi:thiosulfate/3-mercaptopyruvate sulfurtransferase
LISDDEIRAKFEAAGITGDKEVTATCGAGIFTCTSIFALTRIGYKNIKMYDGSWQEYSQYKVPDFTDPDWESKFVRTKA